MHLHGLTCKLRGWKNDLSEPWTEQNTHKCRPTVTRRATHPSQEWKARAALDMVPAKSRTASSHLQSRVAEGREAKPAALTTGLGHDPNLRPGSMCSSISKTFLLSQRTLWARAAGSNQAPTASQWIPWMRQKNQEADYTVNDLWQCMCTGWWGCHARRQQVGPRIPGCEDSAF